MRGVFKTVSVLFLLMSFLLVYTLRIYWLSSALILLAWFFFLLVSAFVHSRAMALISTVFWLLILVGFARALTLASPDLLLPASLSLLRDAYYVIFLLPLAGLPLLHTVCLPISAGMFSLSLLIFWFLHRSARANKARG